MNCRTVLSRCWKTVLALAGMSGKQGVVQILYDLDRLVHVTGGGAWWGKKGERERGRGGREASRIKVAPQYFNKLAQPAVHSEDESDDDGDDSEEEDGDDSGGDSSDDSGPTSWLSYCSVL
nr:hypothetical protein BaRGS_032413 [Batillaria attramentaria]